MIKEVIVVEGREDIRAVKAALDAEVVATNGFNYGNKLIASLRDMQKRNGLIILTDPDYAGSMIRKDLDSKIRGCKHAFLPQGKALKDSDIGIENASKEDIIEAIRKARPSQIDRQEVFAKEDLVAYGLAGGKGSSELRDRLGHELGIGYGNSKQFLNRLNSFGIEREEFLQALERIRNNG